MIVMAKTKVIHDRNVCIGCGACAAVCPDFWEMADDGKSRLKGGKDKNGAVFELEVDDPKCNKDAAQSCPVNCIHIEKDGKREV
jgi:ferredoxin